ncbi:MAG: pantetheine-phosphate adenylyltransferase, partial [Patescibacteria group bacterium]|nr:pantetheine-phosphate adenylyltransferase [Patescibacteria group bacterium]
MFNLVAVAGTFDHLHLGHQKLLESAKARGHKVIVGLCQKSMLTRKAFPQSLESYTVRSQALAKFKPDRIFPLTDIYGPATTITAFDAIVCTSNTQANVKKINRQRRLNNLNYLSIIKVPLVKCSNGQILSSTLIRQGLINRQGLVYTNLFLKNLTLPPSQRRYFQPPLNRPLKTITPPQYLCITVGDIATISLLQQKIIPNLAVVDLKTRRRPLFNSLADLGLKKGLTTHNPAGTITTDLAVKILACLSKKIYT